MNIIIGGQNNLEINFKFQTTKINNLKINFKFKTTQINHLKLISKSFIGK